MKKYDFNIKNAQNNEPHPTEMLTFFLLRRGLLQGLCIEGVTELSQWPSHPPTWSWRCRPVPLRQYIINCLLNTWRRSQRGNCGHVCTQPPLTHRTSFRVREKMVLSYGERKRERESQPSTCQIQRYNKCL